MPLDDAGANEALAIEDPAELPLVVPPVARETRHCDLRNQRTRHTELAALSTFSVTAIAPSHGAAMAQRVPGSPIRRSRWPVTNRSRCYRIFA